MRDLFRKNKKTFILFFCLSFLFYGNTLKNKYSLDDEYVTVTNFPVKGQPYTPNHNLVSKGFKGIPKIWQSRYAHDNEGAAEYRPFVITTFAIEYGIFGQNPFMSHLINILLYALTVCILFCVLHELLNSYSTNTTIAFICSLLFLVHPIHTEVVCSLKNRDELLAFFFSLSALWFSLKAYDKPSFKTIFPIFMLLLLGMYSKHSSFLAFAIIPLCLLFFRKVDLKRGAFYVAGIVVILLSFLLIKQSLLTESMVRLYLHFENPLYTDQVPLLQKLVIAIKTFGFYIKFLFFPYPFRYYYGVNTFDISTSPNSYFFIGISFVLLCAYLMFKRKDKLLLFAFLLCCGCITPFVNISTPAPGILAERFAYFASWGFCLLITAALLPYLKSMNFNTVSQFLTKPLLYFVPFILVFLVYIWNRNSNWYNKMSLFEHDVPHLKESAKANSLMGNEYFEAMSNHNSKYPVPTLINKALEHYSLAVKNDSSIYTAYNNAGVVYYSYVGNIDKAGDYFKLAIRHKAEYPQAYENLGNVYKQKKMYDVAIVCYRKALSYKPKQYNSAFELTNCLIAQKKYKGCLIFCEKYLTIFPNDYTFLVQKANCLFFMNKKAESIPVYEQAYQVKPNDALRTYINSLGTPAK